MPFGLFGKRGEKEPSREIAARPEPVPVAVPDAAQFEELGPALWQDIRFGMTLAEVRAARSGAVPPSDDNRLGDGTAAELEIPLLRLADHDFRVLIYARSGRVTQVTIATLGGPTQDDFVKLTGALRLRYGQEVEMNDNPDSMSHAEWLSADGINVSLVCFPAAGILNVNFQNRYSDAARQL